MKAACDAPTFGEEIAEVCRTAVIKCANECARDILNITLGLCTKLFTTTFNKPTTAFLKQRKYCSHT